ncbi:adenosylhomocysteinase [Microbacterium sp.]|uniref:adenosylhomocysteinase n=1 Tax=Microbacterium sp. TaxID=51671 RepID=UPI003C757747
MTGSILDPRLWPSGADRIAWAREFMPASKAVAAELAASGAVRGIRVLVSDVLEPKTASVALGLAEVGAEVVVMCSGRNTDDAVAAALVHEGIPVYARSDARGGDDLAHALAALDHRPEVIIDDGSWVIRLAHTRRAGILPDIIGATEQTTSGVRPLRTMAAEGSLAFPVVAGNDARTKSLFDNACGTGQSVVLAVADILGEPLAGREVVVAGFGRVGTGIARHAAALGARVTVSEVDAVAALQAAYAGYRVEPLSRAAAHADVLISATGIAGTVALEHLLALPDGAAVAVGGGVPNEIALDEARDAGAYEISRNGDIGTWRLPGGRMVRILDDGHCINVSAAEGNPIQIMDLSFGVQLAAVGYLLAERETLTHDVHLLPRELDDHVAALALASIGGGIDHPSARQQAFLTSWVPGDDDE